MNIDTREVTLEPADNTHPLSLRGPPDDNIKQPERRLGIEINRCDSHFKPIGRPICVIVATDILCNLCVDIVPICGQIQDTEPEQAHLTTRETWVLE